MKATLHDLASGSATEDQGIVLESGLWVPGVVVRELIEGTDVSIDNTDPARPVISVTGGGGGAVSDSDIADLINDNTTPSETRAALDALYGGGSSVGVILIENGDDPATYSPSVGDLIFEKAVPPTLWDLRSLASLPTGWATRGSVATTFDAAGVAGTFDAGEGFYYTLGGTTPSGTLEAKEVSGSTFAQMVGPLMHNTVTGKGAMTSWYNSPSGALTLAGNSSHQYAGAFTNGGGTPAVPAWFRIRFDHSNGLCYGSRSTDGTTWSAEATLSYDLAGITEVGLGSLFGSGTAKFEYLKWSPTGGGGGGLLGWWDGSDVVPF